MPNVVAVVGSRSFADYGKLVDFLDCLVIGAIVSGGARGADRLAERYAAERGIPVVLFPPDYARHGRGAPIVRNKLIVDAADLVVAFWDGASAGTRSTIELARKAGKAVHVVPTV